LYVDYLKASTTTNPNPVLAFMDAYERYIAKIPIDDSARQGRFFRMGGKRSKERFYLVSGLGWGTDIEGPVGLASIGSNRTKMVQTTIPLYFNAIISNEWSYKLERSGFKAKWTAIIDEKVDMTQDPVYLFYLNCKPKDHQTAWAQNAAQNFMALS
jgi:hypothetical protein